jgi:hypothetical protein
MFDAIATSLTLVATLLHGVMGCCWHHEHDCCDAAAEHLAVSGEIVGTCSAENHHHDHDDDSGAAPESPAQPEHEHEPCGGRCVYLTTKSIELSGTTSLELFLAHLPTPLPAITERNVVWGGVDESRHSATKPRQQQRALLQNWLI